MKEIRLFSYKMAHDTGFAPNPFHGLLTLANCKPYIRKYKNEGDWIAGFTSKKLNNDNTGEEKLVYLMKVDQKISYNEYWNDPKYECKKPKLNSCKIEDKAGDNIYQPDEEHPSEFKQVKNKNHTPNDKEHDLKGEYVLISERFYYFGGKPLTIPKEICPTIPKGQSAHGVRTYDADKINNFISFIENKYKIGILNYPHTWPKIPVEIEIEENAYNIK